MSNMNGHVGDKKVALAMRAKAFEIEDIDAEQDSSDTQE